MATTTAAPAQDAVKKAPLTLTPQAVAKVREIMATQDPLPAGLRIASRAAVCSGFQYSMAFENQAGMMDKVFSFEGPQSLCGRNLADVPQRLHRGLRREP